MLARDIMTVIGEIVLMVKVQSAIHWHDTFFLLRLRSRFSSEKIPQHFGSLQFSQTKVPDVIAK